MFAVKIRQELERIESRTGRVAVESGAAERARRGACRKRARPHQSHSHCRAIKELVSWYSKAAKTNHTSKMKQNLRLTLYNISQPNPL